MTRAQGPMASLLSMLTITFLVATFAGVCSGLSEGFYAVSCPQAEATIYAKLKEIRAYDEDIYPVLLRLHFHDCFVRGCDASVLLAGAGTERTAPPNARLEGFGAVDVIKAELEKLCPRTVSCADILAYAARDSVRLSGGPTYQVPGGRTDGTVSKAAEAAQFLPGADQKVAGLNQKFAAVGLSPADMVTLSGAHTIGEAACVHMDERIYKFPNSTNGVDPSIPKDFVAKMKKKCNKPGLTDRKFDLDTATSDAFDAKYYSNLMAGKGTLQSDQVLYADPSTRNAVVQHSNAAVFFPAFAKAMVKMGGIAPLKGTQGQIRIKCSAVNPA